MPAFNAEKFVIEAIDSVLQQSMSDFELLIVDDCSTDNTFSLLSSIKDSRVSVFRNEVNKGYLQACNFLFQQAKGLFVTFQDADDLSDRMRFEKQLKFLEVHPHCGACGSRALYFRDNIRDVVRYKDVNLAHNEILAGLFHQNQFCGASVMVRKSILEQTGYYREFFDRIGNEDYDLFFRIAQRHPVGNLDEYLYHVRLTNNSISRVLRSPRQYISKDIVIFLAIQRRMHDIDSLSGYDEKPLQEYADTLLAPFMKDASLLDRKNADLASYNNERKTALFFSFKAVRRSPFQFINWKYLVVETLRTCRWWIQMRSV